MDADTTSNSSQVHHNFLAIWAMHLRQNGADYIGRYINCLAPVAITIFFANIGMHGALSQSYTACASLIETVFDSPVRVACTTLLVHGLMASLKGDDWKDKGKHLLMSLVRFGGFILGLSGAKRLLHPEEDMAAHMHDDASMPVSGFTCQVLCLGSGLLGMFALDLVRRAVHKLRRWFAHESTERRDSEENVGKNFMNCLTPVAITIFFANIGMHGALSQSYTACASLIKTVFDSPMRVACSTLLVHGLMAMFKRGDWKDKGQHLLMGLVRFGCVVGSLGIAGYLLHPEKDMATHVHDDTSTQLSKIACQLLCLGSGVLSMFVPDLGQLAMHKLQRRWRTESSHANPTRDDSENGIQMPPRSSTTVRRSSMGSSPSPRQNGTWTEETRASQGSVGQEMSLQG